MKKGDRIKIQAFLEAQAEDPRLLVVTSVGLGGRIRGLKILEISSKVSSHLVQHCDFRRIF